MNFVTHSHAGGLEVVPLSHQQEIATAINAMTQPIQARAARTLRAQFLHSLVESGWSGEVAVQASLSDISITSLKQNTGLCLQTGNMSRFYADLLKLQAMYLDNTILCGAFVLPSRDVAVVLGDNVAQADRLIRELSLFRKVITLPLVVYTLISIA